VSYVIVAMASLKRTRSLDVIGTDDAIIDAAMDSVFTQVISRRNKKSKRTRATQPKDTNTNAIKTVGDRSANNKATTSSDQADQCVNSYVDCCDSEETIKLLRSELEDTKMELSKMKAEVKQLTAHVYLLSSAIGLPVQSSPPGDTAQLAPSTSVSGSQESSASTSTYAAISGTIHPKPKSMQSAATPAIKNVQRNIVSAVYTDMYEKQRRANNIVIVGLKSTEHQDEKAVVAGMIWSEFGRSVTVKYCRRLGKKIVNRTQNLLVNLSSADDAAFLISNARMLRQSRNDFVRSNIYINADLTPAEALAAYEARCTRRQRRVEVEAKTARQQPLESTDLGDQTDGTRGTAQSGVSSCLNPNTASFTPTTINPDVQSSDE